MKQNTTYRKAAASPLVPAANTTGISSYRKNRPAWRTAGMTMIGALVLLGAAEARPPQPRKMAAQQSGKEAKAVDRAQIEIERKLDTIMIPATEFPGTSLVEVVDSVRTWSKELDTGTTDPAKKGVNFTIRAPRDFQPGLIRLKLEKMSLRKALENLTEASGTRFQVGESGVTLMPKDAPVAPRAQDAAALDEAAKKIIFPEINFQDTTLKEAVASLNKQIKKSSKGRPALTLKIDADKVDGSTAVKELRLRNVPAHDACKYLAQATRTTLVTGGNEIRFTQP